MGYLRLFRRRKIGAGLGLDFSKSGPSLSFGPQGAKVTIGRRGVHTTGGVPPHAARMAQPEGQRGRVEDCPDFG